MKQEGNMELERTMELEKDHEDWRDLKYLSQTEVVDLAVGSRRSAGNWDNELNLTFM